MIKNSKNRIKKNTAPKRFNRFRGGDYLRERKRNAVNIRIWIFKNRQFWRKEGEYDEDERNRAKQDKGRNRQL